MLLFPKADCAGVWFSTEHLVRAFSFLTNFRGVKKQKLFKINTQRKIWLKQKESHWTYKMKVEHT